MVPEYPDAHEQEYWLTKSVHVPEFLHGVLAHSLISDEEEISSLIKPIRNYLYDRNYYDLIGIVQKKLSSINCDEKVDVYALWWKDRTEHEDSKEIVKLRSQCTW